MRSHINAEAVMREGQSRVWFPIRAATVAMTRSCRTQSLVNKLLLSYCAARAWHITRCDRLCSGPSRARSAPVRATFHASSFAAATSSMYASSMMLCTPISSITCVIIVCATQRQSGEPVHAARCTLHRRVGTWKYMLWIPCTPRLQSPEHSGMRSVREALSCFTTPNQTSEPFQRAKSRTAIKLPTMTVPTGSMRQWHRRRRRFRDTDDVQHFRVRSREVVQHPGHHAKRLRRGINCNQHLAPCLPTQAPDMWVSCEI